MHVETGLIRAGGRGGQRRSPGRGVSRRREMPRGGDGSSTMPPPATEPGDGRRRANRSPGAAAMAESRRRIAIEDPSSRSIASRGPRTTSASACAVPRWRRRRSRSAGWSSARSGDGPRIATRIRDVATTRASVVRTCPRRRRSPVDAADQQRGATTGDGRDRRPVDLHLADAQHLVAGHPPQRRPRRHGPAAQAAGHDRAPTLAPRTRGRSASRPARLRRLATRPETSASAATRRHARRRSRRRSSTTPRGPGRPASVVARAGRGRRPRPPRRAASSARSVFVTTASPSSHRRARRGARGARASARAARRRRRRRAAPHRSRPAPTSMLPTSRSWPGTSTKSSRSPSPSARWA